MRQYILFSVCCDGFISSIFCLIHFSLSLQHINLDIVLELFISDFLYLPLFGCEVFPKGSWIWNTGSWLVVPPWLCIWGREKHGKDMNPDTGTEVETMESGTHWFVPHHLVNLSSSPLTTQGWGPNPWPSACLYHWVKSPTPTLVLIHLRNTCGGMAPSAMGCALPMIIGKMNLKPTHRSIRWEHFLHLDFHF